MTSSKLIPMALANSRINALSIGATLTSPVSRLNIPLSLTVLTILSVNDSMSLVASYIIAIGLLKLRA